MNKFKEIKPEFVVVKIDETEYWSNDIVEAAGKIEAVYIYDKTFTQTWCSPSEMYWLQHLYNISSNEPENEIESEILYMNLNTVVSDGNDYKGCRFIDSIQDKHTCNIEISDDEWQDEESYNELLERVAEIYICNHVF